MEPEMKIYANGLRQGRDDAMEEVKEAIAAELEKCEKEYEQTKRISHITDSATLAAGGHQSLISLKLRLFDNKPKRSE